MDIDEMRQLPAGSYWTDPDNTLLQLEDVPTGGPLFDVVGTDDDHYSKVQVEADEFNTEDFTRVHIFHESDDREIKVKFDSSGVEHLYRFGIAPNGDAWPKYLVQGGETYRVNLEEIPEFVLNAVREVYDAEVNER